MKNNTSKKFWDRSARIYDRYMREQAALYDQIYRLMYLRFHPNMEVLELAAGTGLIALQIAKYVKSVEATDFSEKMLAVARSKPLPQNVRFCTQDATCLTYPDQCFDAIIISNALHIMPHPEKALAEIHRVLKDDGLLIAPNFTHKGLSFFSRLKASVAKLFGFGVFSVWSPQEYIAYIKNHGFQVQYSCVLKASFPLTYVEASKQADA
jgi:ubiquinone/menaquinone biosynthesis C-methylase UbiE